MLSDIKYKTEYITVEEKTSPHEGYIQVLNADGYPLNGVSVYLNYSESPLTSNEYGRILLGENKPLAYFEVAYITLSKTLYTIKNTKASIYLITVFEQNPTGKKYFNNTKWQFKKRGIKTGDNIILTKTR